MNCEVDKAHKKLEALHNELGTDNVMAWQREHAAEVLTLAQREHMGLMEKS
ncbi:hypothetical protein FSP39_015443 [Pinctada imbricata]|uniref:Uncharacterized protein n=1 Tax=Pinctada imbricata TaxID=66713 RepID=A0AA89BI27_PINIB|nr:hypothetical protein FSP39_015443 [Pinctada imbricata]